MRWPWQRKPEVRQSQPFTDAIVAAITAEAAGATIADPSGHWALETAAGLYSRAFAGATVEAPDVVKAALKPATRALIARDLIRRGQSIHEISVHGGRIELLPAGSWDIRGGWQPESWWYRLDLFGPSGNSDAPIAGRGGCRLPVRR